MVVLKEFILARPPSCTHEKGSGQKGHTSLFLRHIYCSPIGSQNRSHMTLVECNYAWSVRMCMHSVLHMVWKWRLVSILHTPELSIIAFQLDALVRPFCPDPFLRVHAWRGLGMRLYPDRCDWLMEASQLKTFHICNLKLNLNKLIIEVLA